MYEINNIPNPSTITTAQFEQIRRQKAIQSYLLDAVGRAIANLDSITAQEWQEAFASVQVIIAKRGDRT